MTDAVTRSARFALYLWNDGSAPFTRLQMTTNQLQLEALAAKFRTGVSGDMGAANATDNVRSFFYNTSDARLYFSNGTGWVAISGSVLPSNLASSVAGSGLSLNSSTGLEVNVDDSTLEISADDLRVKQGGITANELKTIVGSEAVSRAAIRADAVNQDKIADDSIRQEHILDGEVVVGKLGTNAVVLSNMQDDSVGTGQIIGGSVTGAKIATGSDGIKTANIDDGQVTGAKIAAAPSGVNTGNINALAVTGAKVALAPDGITDANINEAGLTLLNRFGGSIRPTFLSGSAPSSPVAGQTWMNTTNGRLFVWSGTAWRFIGGRPYVCVATRSDDATIAHNTWQEMAAANKWSAVDSDSIWVAPNKMVLPISGYWLVNAEVRWTGTNNTGYRRLGIHVVPNATVSKTYTQDTAPTFSFPTAVGGDGQELWQGGATVRQFDAGDTLRVIVKQATTGVTASLDILDARFSVTFVGDAAAFS